MAFVTAAFIGLIGLALAILLTPVVVIVLAAMLWKDPG
jgi:hypothetical protein